MRFRRGWRLEANVQPRVTTAAGVPSPGSDGSADISNQPTCLIRAFHTCYPDFLNKYKWFEAKAAKISTKYSYFKQKIFHICHFWLCQNVERKQYRWIQYSTYQVSPNSVAWNLVGLIFLISAAPRLPQKLTSALLLTFHPPTFDSNVTIGNDKLVPEEERWKLCEQNGESLQQKQQKQQGSATLTA